MRMRHRNTLPATLIVVAGALVMGAMTAPANAVFKLWDPAGVSFDWHTANNWSPTGVPTTNDDVQFDNGLILLSADTAGVNNLFVALGSTLLTNGHTLNIDASGFNGRLTIDGANVAFPSVSVFPVTGGVEGLEADQVRLSSGASLVLNNDGARADIDATLLINAGGKLRTNGPGMQTVNLLGFAGNPVLNNNGTIDVEGDMMLIRTFGPELIDLDGTGTEAGVVNVDSGSTLKIEGTLADDFNGTMNLGSGGSTAVLNMIQPWNIGGTASPGEIILNNGALTGENLDNFGTIRGHGSITNRFFRNKGTLSAEGGTITINNLPFSANLGAFGSGSIVNALDGDFDVTLTGSAGFRAFSGVMNIGEGHEFRTNDGYGLISGGVMNLSGGTFVGKYFGVQINGTLHVMPGPESRIEETSFRITFENGTIILDSDLRLIGDSEVLQAATFTGGGTLIINEFGRLKSDFSATATIGTHVLNEGTVAPAGTGLSIFLTGRLEFGADFTQADSGKLEIEIGGTVAGTDHDEVAVMGTANLDGTLKLVLFADFEDFTPSLGDTFTFLTANSGINGTFSQVLFPVIPDIGLGVLYSPNSVSLFAGLLGDLNGDGFVGIDDLNIVLIAWNGNVDAGVWINGDPTGDGFVGVDDLNIVLVNWNAGTPPGDAANIPEPGSAVMGVVLLSALGRSCSRRRIA